MAPREWEPVAAAPVFLFIIDLHSLILVCTNHIGLQFHNHNYFIL